MRAIAIAVAAFLIAVAAAYGSRQQTAVLQRAIEAPRPAGVSTRQGGSVDQIACATTRSCAAVGKWLLTRSDRTWRATQPPSLAGGGGIILHSLSCPAAGRCVATGVADGQHAVRLTESGSRWSLAEFALPADAASISPYPGIPVSCASAGSCTAVGPYFGSDHATHALLVGESRGTWGATTDVQLPPDAATTYPLPDAQAQPGGFLSSVSCPSAGSCSAVGSYTRADQTGGTYGSYPWVLDESGGHWASALSLKLPADAATSRDYRAVHSSPFMGFAGLSCPTPGNCTAVGAYIARADGPQGVSFTERAGTWSRGVRLPTPRNAVADTDPQELDSPMTSLSCAAPNDCAATGWYFVKYFGNLQGLLLRERHGTWKASELAWPAGAPATSQGFPISVSCASRGGCLATGFYSVGPRSYGVIVRQRAGKWGRAIRAALPANAAKPGRSHTFLDTVACSSSRSCVAGGYYDDRLGISQGLLLNLHVP